MSINQHNYELYILDHYEGKLDATATRELMLYLEQNPEAREAFESYEEIMLSPDLCQQFEPKSSLKKTAIIAVDELNEENYEECFIESVENNLTSITAATLTEFLSKNPHLQKNLDTYKKTILQPDLSVVFDGKEMLKKTPVVPLRPAPVRRLVFISFSVAAVLAVIMISGIIIRSFDASDKSGSNAISATDHMGIPRKINAVINQRQRKGSPKPINNFSNQTNSSNITLANINTSDNKFSLEKLPIRKGNHIETTGNIEQTTSAILVKRSEYSDLINERQILLSRRNNENNISRDEGIADYVVNGIKKAARSTTKNKEDIKNNKKIGFWDIAGFGVYAYNKITDKNLCLDKKTDASGRLMSLNLEDNNFLPDDKK